MGVREFKGVTVCFPVAVIRCPDQKNSLWKGFLLAHTSSPPWQGSAAAAAAAEIEGTGGLVPSIQKQREKEVSC